MAEARKEGAARVEASRLLGRPEEVAPTPASRRELPQSRVYQPGPYSKREALSVQFDREVLKALGGHDS